MRLNFNLWQLQTVQQPIYLDQQKEGYVSKIWASWRFTTTYYCTEWFYTLHLWGSSCIPPSPPTPKAIWGSTNNTSSVSMKSGNEQCTCLSRVDIQRHNKLFQIFRLSKKFKDSVKCCWENVHCICPFTKCSIMFLRIDNEPPTIEEYFQ